jgi:hypothetical protein
LQLEARVLQLEPRKRHKVVTSPNSRFADIEAIYKAQVKARDRQNCHERQLQGLERKAKVEGSQLRLYKAKEGRNEGMREAS